MPPVLSNQLRLITKEGAPRHVFPESAAKLTLMEMPMTRILKMTMAIWFGLLALGVGVGLMPWTQAAEISQTEAPPQQETSSFPGGVGYFGGQLGIGTADNNIGTGLGYGGEIAFFPKTYIGLGGIFRGINHGTAKSNLYGAEVLLRPVQPLTLGFLLGGTSVTDAGPNSATAFAYGGKLGYDFRLGQTPFTLGPEVDVLFFKPAEQTVSNVNMLAAFKIWI